MRFICCNLKNTFLRIARNYSQVCFIKNRLSSISQMCICLMFILRLNETLKSLIGHTAFDIDNNSYGKHFVHSFRNSKVYLFYHLHDCMVCCILLFGIAKNTKSVTVRTTSSANSSVGCLMHYNNMLICIYC